MKPDPEVDKWGRTAGSTFRLFATGTGRRAPRGRDMGVFGDVVPPRVEYSLTSVGRSLLTIVQSLAAWTNDNLEFITTARQSYDARTQAEYSDP